MNRMSELKPGFRRTNRGEIRGERTRHVRTFNSNKAGPGEETYYVNIPKLRAESVLVPDSMSLMFDFKNKNEKSWFRNKLLHKRLEIRMSGEKFTITTEEVFWRCTKICGFLKSFETTWWKMVSPAKLCGRRFLKTTQRMPTLKQLRCSEFAEQCKELKSEKP